MDHQRCSIQTTAMSCGVLLLSNMTTDINGMLYQIATRLYHPSRGDPAAFITWSDIVTFDDHNLWIASHPISDLVAEHKFGEVLMATPTDNPKTGNCISVWTWTINHESFKKWYSSERVRRISKAGT